MKTLLLFLLLTSSALAQQAPCSFVGGYNGTLENQAGPFNIMLAEAYTPSSAVTVNTIWYYVDGPSGNTYSVGIYISTTTNTLITQATATSPASNAWTAFTIPDTALSSGQLYFIAVGYLNLYNMSSANPPGLGFSTGISSLPIPNTVSSFDADGVDFGIFADYCAPPTPTPTPVPPTPTPTPLPGSSSDMRLLGVGK